MFKNINQHDPCKFDFNRVVAFLEDLMIKYVNVPNLSFEFLNHIYREIVL